MEYTSARQPPLHKCKDRMGSTAYAADNNANCALVATATAM